MDPITQPDLEEDPTQPAIVQSASGEEGPTQMELSLEDIDPDYQGEENQSQADMSMVSFDSATYASFQGLSQWELLMKIADERRLGGDIDASLSQEASVDHSLSKINYLQADVEKLEKNRYDLEFQVESMRERLKRRNVLIGTIREAYLRDVIELKTVMFGVLTESERLRVVSQWETSIPSLDLRKPIELCAPLEAEFSFSPCGSCGGQVEIFHRQSTRMVKLEASLLEYRKKQDQMQALIAMQKSMLDRTEMNMAEVQRLHTEEKQFLYTELRQSKSAIEEKDKDIANLKSKNRHLYSENTKLNEDNRDFILVKDELRAAEREVRKQAGNIDLLNERIVRHEHKISDLEQEAELMRVESIDTLKRFNDEKEMTLMLRSELKATNEALLASKAKAAGLTNNLDTAKAKIEDLQATVSRLQGELVSLDQLMSSEAARYKNEISGLDNSLVKEQSQAQKLEERLVEKSLALANAEMFVEDLLMTVLQNEDDMGDLEDEVAEKEEEIEELKAYVQELTDNSRPSSRLNTGNDSRFARSSSHEDTGELSSREVSMVKGLQQLQGQLVALQAQYQLVTKQVSTQFETIQAQSAALLACQQQMASDHLNGSVNGSPGGLKVALLQKKLAVSIKTSEDAESRRAGLEAELSLCQISLAKVREEHQSLQELFDKAVAGASSADLQTEQISRLEEIIATRAKEAEAAAMQAQELQASLVALQKTGLVAAEELQALLKASQQADDREKSLAKELLVVEHRLEQSDQEIVSLRQKLEQLHQTHVELTQTNSEQSRAAVQLQSELEAAVQARESLQVELASLKVLSDELAASSLSGDEAAKAFYAKQTALLEDMLIKSKRELDAANTRFAEREGTLEAQRSSLQYLQAELEENQAGRAGLQQKAAQLQLDGERCSDLERQLAAAKADASSLQEQLKQAQDDLQLSLQTSTTVEDAKMFSEDELKSLQQEQQQPTAPAFVIDPALLQPQTTAEPVIGEVLCKLCQEKVNPMEDIEKSSIDVSQWAFFLPTPEGGSINATTGSRRDKRGMRKAAGSRGEGEAGHRPASTKASSEAAKPAEAAKPVPHKAAPEVIVLLEPSAGAPPEELGLREDLVGRLCGVLGPMTGKKAMNSIVPVVEVVGSLLNEAAKAQWKWMVFSKKACDMYPSLLSVFASMVQCIEEGSEEQDVKRASLQADRVLEAEKFLPPTSSTWLLGQYVEAPRSRESLELTEAFEQQLRALQEAQQEKDSLLQDELTTAEGQLARLDEGDEESRSFVLQHMDSLYAQRDEEQASVREASSELQDRERQRLAEEATARMTLREDFDTIARYLSPLQGERFPSHEVLFGSGEDLATDRLAAYQRAELTLECLDGFLTATASALLLGLVPIVADWADGKSLAYKLERLMEEVRRKEQAVGDKKASDLDKELKMMTRKFETCKAEKIKAERKCDQLIAEVDSLRTVESDLRRAQEKTRELVLERDLFQARAQERESAALQAQKETDELRSTLAATNADLARCQLQLAELITRVDAQVTKMVLDHEEKALFVLKYEQLVQAERERLAGQRHVSTQIFLKETHAAAVQTEFITTDMSIVTTVAGLEDSLPTIGKRKQFPLTVAVPSGHVSLGSARPVFGSKAALRLLEKPRAEITEAEVARISELTQEFMANKLRQTEKGSATSMLSLEEAEVLEKRAQVARLRSVIAREARAKLKLGEGDDRQRRSIDEKIDRKRAQVDKIQAEIALLESCTQDPTSSPLSLSVRFMIPSVSGSVASASFIESAKSQSLFGPGPEEGDSMATSLLPPPHTPQSPFLSESVSDLGLGFSPATRRHTHLGRGGGPAQTQLAPSVLGYQSLRSEAALRHKQMLALSRSLPQPLLPAGPLRLRNTPSKPSMLSFTAETEPLEELDDDISLASELGDV